jgi:hypothetical protein
MNNIFINIARLFYEKERKYRVYYLLNPSYFIEASYKNKMHGEISEAGWKHDSSYILNLPSTSRLGIVFKREGVENKILLVNYLISLFTDKKYKNLHPLQYNKITQFDEALVETLIKKYSISDDDILEGSILIDNIVSHYFQNMVVPYKPVWELSNNPEVVYSMYTYCKFDMRSNKLRFLISENDMLQDFYDTPVLPLRHSATHLRPTLLKIIVYLDDKKEIMFRWMENILESIYESMIIDGEGFYREACTLVEAIKKNKETGQIRGELGEHYFNAIHTMLAEIITTVRQQYKWLEKSPPKNQPQDLNLQPTKIEEVLNSFPSYNN